MPARWVAPPSAVGAAMLESFRRRMWPLLGQTVLECMRVLDWVDDRFDAPGPRVAGGVSMGGDVAIAFAGIDGRISRVAAPRALDRVQVRVHEGVSHLDGARDDRLYAAALEWLTLTSRA